LRKGNIVTATLRGKWTGDVAAVSVHPHGMHARCPQHSCVVARRRLLSDGQRINGSANHGHEVVQSKAGQGEQQDRSSGASHHARKWLSVGQRKTKPHSHIVLT
jgi:hypothetical protein